MKLPRISVRSGSASLPGLAALALALGLSVAAPSPSFAGDAESPSSVYIDNSGVKSLQLGVGRSMIIDLPEDAAEIFVGEPKVANAIVRSPRRLYISTLAAGQTSIFALAATGRKIAVLEITVGRDVGELAKLFEVAIPGNDIHVRTVGGSIILTGSVASAGEAQKALDIAEGFLSNNDGALIGLANMGGGAGPAAPEAAAVVEAVEAAAAAGGGKVVNSLTIRGLDQVSLRVTVSEIRRDIIKQLGVNIGAVSTGNGLKTLNWTNPFSINGTAAAEGAESAWTVGSATLTATLQAYEQQGVARTLAEPTVTAISGESAKFLAGGTIPIPNGETCQGGICTLGIIQQPYGVSLAFTPVVLSQGRIQLRIATEVTDVDPSKTLTIAADRDPRLPHPQERDHCRTALGRFDRHCGIDLHTDAAAISGLPGSDESAGARGAVPLARLSASGDGTADHRHALHRSRASTRSKFSVRRRDS